MTDDEIRSERVKVDKAVALLRGRSPQDQAIADLLESHMRAIEQYAPLVRALQEEFRMRGFDIEFNGPEGRDGI